MLFTLSKPHKHNEKQLENRISKHYISFFGVCKQEDYVELSPSHYILNGDKKKIKEQAFMPAGNKDKYLVKSSDANTSVPRPLILDGLTYEPAIVKIWLPDTEILLSTLETLSTSAYFKYVQKDNIFLEADSEASSIFDNWIQEYNATISEEQERREFFKKQMLNYEQGLELLRKSSYSHWEI